MQVFDWHDSYDRMMFIFSYLHNNQALHFLGRNGENQLVFKNQRVSWRHARMVGIRISFLQFYAEIRGSGTSQP
jgi:hypothetical protein